MKTLQSIVNLTAKHCLKHIKSRKSHRELVKMLGVEYMPVDEAITKNINKFFISDLAEGMDQDQQLTLTFSEAERWEKLDQIEVNIQGLLCHLDEWDVKKSTKTDGIQSRALKYLKNDAASWLDEVYDLALQTATTRGPWHWHH